MTVPEIIERIQGAGASIVVEGGNLKVSGAKLPEELRTTIKESKPAIIEHLRDSSLSADPCPVAGVGCEHLDPVGNHRLCTYPGGRSINALMLANCPRKAGIKFRPLRFRSDIGPAEGEPDTQARKCVNCRHYEPYRGCGKNHAVDGSCLPRECGDFKPAKEMRPWIVSSPNQTWEGKQ